MTEDQLQRAMQANYIEYFRPFQMLPSAQFYEDDEVTWVLPMGAPGNHVLRADFSAESIPQKLKTLFETLDQYVYVVRWLVYEHDSPSDLGDQLAEFGLTGSTGEPCMLRNLDQLPPQSKIDELKIVQVTTEAQLDDWRRATGNGFGGGYLLAGRWSETYRLDGLQPDGDFLHYIGYFQGKPVTSASLLLAGGIAGIYDVSTDPAYRKRGFASAITLAQLHEAKRRGFSHAYLRSSKEGKPVYERLGFETHCYEREYLWRSRRLTM